jgi:hypothetical protein
MGPGAPGAVVEEPGRLKKSGTVTLDSSGNGTVAFTCDNAWQRWEVTGIVVKTDQASTTIPVPIAEVFVNSTSSPANSEGATSSGNGDTFAGLTEVGHADTLNVAWSGGVAGSVATAILTGTTYQRRA